MSVPHIVVDASALIDALAPTTKRPAVLDALLGHELWAPQILDVEVASALARLERAGELSSTEASRAIDDLLAFPVTRIDSSMLLAAAWGARGSLRISDAFYVAAARMVGSPLLTTDARLARAPIADVTVALVP